jgi:hypothetical protein
LLAITVAPVTSLAGRHTGLGVGFRGDGGREEARWTYVPLLLPITVAVRDHLAATIRIELAPRYLAIRPGMEAKTCSRDRWACVGAVISVGAGSAAFGAPERVPSVIAGLTLVYENRLGPSAYVVRLEAERIHVRRAGSQAGATDGIGMGAYLLRTF